MSDFLSDMPQMVRNIQPGQELEFSDSVTCGLMPLGYPEPLGDYILGQIMGSAYEYSWHRNERGNIVFRRRVTPYPSGDGKFSFVSRDRAHLVDKIRDGLYVSKGGGK